MKKFLMLIAVALALASPLLAAVARSTPRTIVSNQTTTGASPHIRATEGHKTVHIEFTGTATVTLNCKVSADATVVDVLDTLTGANQADSIEFDSSCVELWTDTSVCTGCHVSAWIDNPEGEVS